MPFGGLLTAGISAGGSALGGLFGSKGANKAAKLAAEGKQKAATLATQAGDYGKVQAGIGQTYLADAGADIQRMLSPYMQAGDSSLSALEQLSSTPAEKFSFNPSDLQNDPGYKFTLDQGQKAIQRSQAAKGGLFSTGTLKALADYGTGSADKYFNDAYTRAASTFGLNQQSAQQRINTLQDLAHVGYGATTTGAQLSQANAGARAGLGIEGAQFGMQGAQAAGNAYIGQGNDLAQGKLGSTNSWLNALQGGTNSLIDYLNGPRKVGSGSVHPGGDPGGILSQLDPSVLYGQNKPPTVNWNGIAD